MAARYHRTTTDYSGRSVDMLLLQYLPMPSAEAVVTPDVSDEPRMVTGVEKLVQRYALIFLTQTGSVRNVESEGTEFMSLLGSGRIYDEATLRSAAAAANKRTVSQIKVADRSLDTPADEALDTAEVTRLGIDRARASVSVTVTLRTVAGDSYVYTMPLKTGA